MIDKKSMTVEGCEPLSYCPDLFADQADRLLELVRPQLLSRTEVRQECFLSPTPRDYTYGVGRGARTYSSTPMCRELQEFLSSVSMAVSVFCGYGIGAKRFNAVFVNQYLNKRQHLGWHADDSPEQDPHMPIAVVSFGQAREIWWRPNGQKGEVPPSQRQMLEHGSLFVMSPGFQDLYQHRIPKGDREMGERLSFTFRCFR